MLQVLGKGIKGGSQKRGLLLHTASLEIQDVYFTLVPDGEHKDYPTTLSRETCFAKLLKVTRRQLINSSVS